MKIKICEENRARINEVFAEIEGTGYRRCLSYDGVSAMSRRAENAMNDAGLPSSRRQGASGRISHDVPKAYHYLFKSTSATLYRGKEAWFLTAADRDEWWPGGERSGLSLCYTDEQVDYLTGKLAAELRRSFVDGRWVIE